MGELISKNEGTKESLLLYVQREHVTIKARRYLDEGSFFDGFLGQMLQSRAYPVGVGYWLIVMRCVCAFNRQCAGEASMMVLNQPSNRFENNAVFTKLVQYEQISNHCALRNYGKILVTRMA